MLNEVIYKNYGIVMEREMSDRHKRFFSGNTLFTIMPIQELNEEELVERLNLSDFMRQKGDPFVSSFVLSREQTFLSEFDDGLFILLANAAWEKPYSPQVGYQLAQFHALGRTFGGTLKVSNRIGLWKELWETRIDQLEAIWREKIQAHPSNEFEQLLCESFPYYMALGENALQYLVDGEIDDEPAPVDAGTVCHERFYTDTWVGQFLVKNPFDWVFDHHGRDIAEWIRQHHQLYPHTYQLEMAQFIREYEQYMPLSGFAWRLVYSRLLFPVHYFEIIEDYYSTKNQEAKKKLGEKMEKTLKQTQTYEEFLRNFFEVNRIPASTLQIPKIDWLS